MKEMLRPHDRRSGFTILEILVAVTILTMISTMLFGTFFYTTDIAEEQEERAALYHRASFILGNISQSVSSAYVPYAGFYIDEEAERPIFLGEADLLSESQAGSLGLFTTSPRIGGAQGGEIAFVSYRIDEADDDIDAIGWIADERNPLALSCTVEPLLRSLEQEDESAPLWILSVSSLNLEYFDGAGWLPDWDYEDQGILPDAVRIDLELADSNGDKHSFSTIAYVHVSALLEEPREIVEEEEVVEEETEEEEAEEEEAAEETEETEGAGEGQAPIPPPPEGGGQGIFPEGPGTFPFG